MSPQQQHSIDNAHRICKRISETGLLVLLALGLLILIPPIFTKLGIDCTQWKFYLAIASVYKFAAGIVGIITICALVLTLILSAFATNNEREQMKTDMKEILQEIKAEKKAKTTTDCNGESPLIGLDDRQTAKVHEWLKGILVKNDHLKTSKLVQLLRALKELENLDDSNKELLISWVESITGREVDRRNFLYDYDNKYSQNKVNKEREVREKLLYPYRPKRKGSKPNRKFTDESR